MKKLTLLATLFAVSLLLVACGSGNSDTPAPDKPTEDNSSSPGDSGTNGTNGENSNDPSTDDINSNDGNDPATGEQDELSLMETLPYKEFELEVEYADRNEYEAELKLKHGNRVEAEIEDDLSGVKVKGSEAFDQLYALVEKLSIEQGTKKEDAIQDVLTVFDLSSDYTEFELEITFHDGTELEFKDKK